MPHLSRRVLALERSVSPDVAAELQSLCGGVLTLSLGVSRRCFNMFFGHHATVQTEEGRRHLQHAGFGSSSAMQVMRLYSAGAL